MRSDPITVQYALVNDKITSYNSFNKFLFGAGFKLDYAKWQLKIDYSMNPALNYIDMPDNMSHFFGLTFNSLTKMQDIKTRSIMDKAQDKLKKDNFDEAEKEVDRALEIYPENEKLITMKTRIQKERIIKEAEVRMVKADEYLKYKNYDSARKELETVVKLTPENKEAQNNLGKVYYEQGEYSAAMACFKKRGKKGILHGK